MSYPKKIIYITYDSVLEPLGQSQVLKYISKSNYNKNILLLSFEEEKIFLIKKILTLQKILSMMQILNGNIFFIVINFGFYLK